MRYEAGQGQTREESMKHARKIVAASVTALLIFGGSFAAAAELQTLRKGLVPTDKDGVVSPRGLSPSVQRRGRDIRRQCEDGTPASTAGGSGNGRGARFVALSSYEDDPFVADSIIECRRSSDFNLFPDGRRV